MVIIETPLEGGDKTMGKRASNNQVTRISGSPLGSRFTPARKS